MYSPLSVTPAAMLLTTTADCGDVPSSKSILMLPDMSSLRQRMVKFRPASGVSPPSGDRTTTYGIGLSDAWLVFPYAPILTKPPFGDGSPATETVGSARS